jgi:uncharacterized membrane protein
VELSITTSFQLGFGVPMGAPMAYALAAAFAALALYGSRPQGVSGAARALLVGLRWLSALAAFGLAAQPTFWVERKQQEPGQIAVLVDTSRSMGVSTEGRTRIEVARKLVQRLRSGAKETTVRLYGVAAKATPLAPLALEQLAADGAASELVPALTELSRDAELGAMLLLSDGADTSEVHLPADFSTRLHTVLMADARPLRDDAIASVQADAVAFLRGEAKVTATISTRGLGNRQLFLVLRRKGKVLGVRPVQVSEDASTSVELSFTPEALGREAYTLELQAEGEDGRDDVPENNERAFLVRVSRDRLRVLHVSGRPSWDQRFLRGFLKRDPSLDLVSFFILRSVHDLTMSSPSELALIPFPTDELFRQHLTSFDVVLLQDFDFAPYQMAPYLPLMRDYVRAGGGLAMIGGMLSFDGGGYGETALAEALPVRIQPTDPRGARVVDGPFSPVLPGALLNHPLLELAPSTAQTLAVFRRLAPLQGANALDGARAGSTVLLEHPTARTKSGEKLPILSVGGFGKGRSLALATDTSWHWSMPTAGAGGDPSAYDRFWDRVVRWLSHDPLLDPSRITTAQASYTPRSPVEVSGLVRSAEYALMRREKLSVRISGEGGGVLATLPVESDDQASFGASLEAPALPGVYEAEVFSGDTRLAHEPFLVELAGVELSKPEPQPETLEQLARRTGGHAYGSAREVPALDDLDRSRTTSLGIERHAPFSQPWWAVGAFLVIALEWVVRRRLGLR